MPRRSSASLSVLTPLPTVERLRPPRGLTAPQRAHFAAVVAAVPADRFTHADVPLLVALSRHLALADACATLVENADDTEAFDKAAAMLSRETGRITALMTRLRLTPQARYTPDNKRLRQRGGGGIEALIEERRDED